MRKISLSVLILCGCAAFSLAYELREWKDVNGKSFTGRFVRELFGKLTIEDDEGNDSVFEIEDLSDLDKKYIRVMIPPKIEAVVRTQSNKLEPRPADLTRMISRSFITWWLMFPKKVSARLQVG